MKLNFDPGTATHRITHYESGAITINGSVWTEHLIVLPERVHSDWGVHAVSELSVEDFAILESYDLEVILLGTGDRQAFPPRDVMRHFREQQIGLEVMDTAAACRTYNVLMSEDRRVAAALIVA
jgi:uncharacterized protein